MTPEGMRAKIKALERRNATQERVIDRYRGKVSAMGKQLTKERGRNEPLQSAVDSMRVQIAELLDKRAQAERFFKDGQE